MKAELVSLHDAFHFRFGAFVRKHNNERNKTLSYKDLAGTETEIPYEPVAYMLNLEMDRRNQAKVIIIIYNSRNNLILETLRLRFFGISRELRTSRSHVTRALPSVLRFEFHVCTADHAPEVNDLPQGFLCP